MRFLLALAAFLLLATPAVAQSDARCFFVRAWSDDGPFHNSAGGTVWLTDVQCLDDPVNAGDVSLDFSALLRRELGQDFVRGQLGARIDVRTYLTLDDAEHGRAQAERELSRGVELRAVGYIYVRARSGTAFLPGSDATQVCFYARAVNSWTETGRTIKRAYVTPVQCSRRQVFNSTVMLQFDPQLRARDPQMGSGGGGARSAWVFTSFEEAERARAAFAGDQAAAGYDVRDFGLRFDEAGLPPLATPAGLVGAAETGSIVDGSGATPRRRPALPPLPPSNCYALLWHGAAGFALPPRCYSGWSAPDLSRLSAQLADWAFINGYEWVTAEARAGSVTFISRGGDLDGVEAAYDSALAKVAPGTDLKIPAGFVFNPYVLRKPEDVQRIDAMQADRQIVAGLDALFSPFAWFAVSATAGVVDMERAMTTVVGVRIRPVWNGLRLHGYMNIDKDNAVPTVSGERIDNWTRIVGGELLFPLASKHVWVGPGMASLEYTVRTGNGLFWDETPGGTETELTGGAHLEFNPTFGVQMRYGQRTGFALGARLGFGERSPSNRDKRR